MTHAIPDPDDDELVGAQPDRLEDFANPNGFVCCDECRAKPGTPNLCRGCLHNHKMMSSHVKRSDQRLKRINVALELLGLGHEDEAISVLEDAD